MAVFICPPKLRAYLAQRIQGHLQPQFQQFANAVVDNIVTSVVLENGIIETGGASESAEKIKHARKVVMDRGLLVDRLVETNRFNHLQLWKPDDFKEALMCATNESMKNKQIFNDILQHHNTLSSQIVDWLEDDHVLSQIELEQYASAATEMGEKQWVQQGNEWMQESALSFFRLGQAKKIFMKRFRKSFVHTLNPTSTVDDCNQIDSVLPTDLFGNSAAHKLNDLFSQTPGSFQRVKVVDVGSCYNPIAKGKYSNLFDVTALDLCPTDNSVYECDFLKLKFGDVGSKPVLEEVSVAQTPNTSQKLLQLPRNSFDAVTMSLVMSYLPTPESRLMMIRQARQLLVNDQFEQWCDVHHRKTEKHKSDYNDHSLPHRVGVLILFDKQSIFHQGKFHDVFLNHWKEKVCEEGFQFVKYQLIKHEHHIAHGLVFAVSSSGPSLTTASGIVESSSVESDLKKRRIANDDNDEVVDDKETLRLILQKSDGLFIKCDLTPEQRIWLTQSKM